MVRLRIQLEENPENVKKQAEENEESSTENPPEQEPEKQRAANDAGLSLSLLEDDGPDECANM